MNRALGSKAHGAKATLRCAIYTRKSSEEGYPLTFDTLLRPRIPPAPPGRVPLPRWVSGLPAAPGPGLPRAAPRWAARGP